MRRSFTSELVIVAAGLVSILTIEHWMPYWIALWQLAFALAFKLSEILI